MAKTELLLLQNAMKEQGIDWYLIPTDDYHQSEYVGEYFKARKWVSGFTGSAGTFVAGKDEAYLFTDGRYYVQAAKEIDGAGIELMKSGLVGVPSPEDFILEKAKKGDVVAFDKRVVSAEKEELLKKGLEKKGASLKDADLIEAIWTDRPKRSAKEVYVLEEKYAGESVTSKLERLRKELADLEMEAHILTSLDDIAWLYNLRGDDVANSPMFLSYTYVTKEEAYLFVQPGVLTEGAKEQLKNANVTVFDYDDVYTFLEGRKESPVLLDKRAVNSKAASSFGKDIVLEQGNNPTTLMKAIKNPVEIANSRSCHIKDGVVMTKFIYWLKHLDLEAEKVTEYTAATRLDNMRREIDTCTDLSFTTIAGYGPNAAMMHYSAKPDTAAVLKPGSFYLVDSGGQYLEGTTDITRTMVLGEITEEQKKHYTAVARGMLNLMSAKFLEGCKGINLDILARGPVWDMAIDYQCGTGHGVGYFANVHEGPNSIRWKARHDIDDCDLKPGMITTDEPGIYLPGQYGIRTENELLCVAAEENEYGRFLEFEPLTYAPIDLDGIEPSYMTEKEKQRLNDYHKLVYDTVSPYLTEEERAWLEEYTRPVQ
jgi:Xaa-Pro aminopeptidase